MSHPGSINITVTYSERLSSCGPWRLVNQRHAPAVPCLPRSACKVDVVPHISGRVAVYAA